MDISPDHKALVLLAATEGKKRRLVEESEQIAARLLERLASPSKSATVMSSLDIDPFRSAAKIHGYEVTIELRANAEPASFAAALEGFADGLRASAHTDLSASTVLVGRDRVFTPSAPQPVRFQYLMRRRADYTHEAYAKRYAEVHSDFGIRTRGVEGYVQFHIDPVASEEAAKLAGFGACDFDSVSELHLKSLTSFLLATPYNATLGATKDEELFVDRTNSIMFVSRVVARLKSARRP